MKLTRKLGSKANSRSGMDLRIPGRLRVITLNPAPGRLFGKVLYFGFSGVLHSQTLDLLGCVESTGSSQPRED